MISHHPCKGAVQVGRDDDGRTRITCLSCNEVIAVLGVTDPDQERDSSGMHTVAHEDATQRADDLFIEEWQHLKRQLASPPEGWYTFGPHRDIAPDVPLEFWGTGWDGLPLWQRPRTSE